jgi:hypothetical protein
MEKSTRGSQTSAKTADPAKVSYWEKTKAATKAWFDKLSNKLGAETFWPAPLDKESEKAARILRSFCIDGYEAEETTSQESGQAAGKPSTDKKHKRHQIPQEVSVPSKSEIPSTSPRSYATPRVSPSSPSSVPA